MLPVRLIVQHKESKILGEVLTCNHVLLKVERKGALPGLKEEERLATLLTVAWEDDDQTVNVVPIEAVKHIKKLPLFDMTEFLEELAASDTDDDDDDDGEEEYEEDDDNEYEEDSVEYEDESDESGVIDVTPQKQ